MSNRWVVSVPICLLSVLTLWAQQHVSGPQPSKSSGEVSLVEKLMVARKDYQNILQQVRTYYRQVGDNEKLSWAEEELKEYHMMLRYPYIKDLICPPPTLQGTVNIREANDLFERALKYKDHGWSTEYVANQRRAEILFQELITKYPQSDKISSAAYMLGDIYESKAFNMPRPAAWFFERCFQWDTRTKHDALIRAARIYDHKLKETGTALEFYGWVYESQVDPAQRAEAQKRRNELRAR